MKTVHSMNLHPSPFKKIIEGTKIIEIRLNDDKRKLLKVGDEIEFTSREDTTQKIMTEVVGLDVFKSFKELCEAYPPTDYGSTDKSEYSLMYKYYSLADEAKYGVLAIGLKYLG